MDFADRLDRIQASGIREIFDRSAKLDDPINLSIGQPSFDVPEDVKQEAKRAIDRGENQYTGTRGLPRLRKRIREDVEGRTGVKPEATLVTAGVSGGLLLALLARVDAGEEVLVPDPYFVSYKQLTHLLEAKPVFLDTYPTFKLTAEQLQKNITEQSSVLLFNNPGNPTGIAYEKEEVQAIARVCRANDLLIISDEIYAHFTYDHPQYSMLAAAPERTVLLEGASKSYGMPGWRVGWACGPDRVLDQMATLQQFSFVCAHAPSQRAVITALDHDMQEEISTYRRHRDRLCEGLKEQYKFVKPGGAFYLYPEVPGELSGRKFVEMAMDRNLLIVHGSVFSQQDSHFRISYAVEEDELREGVTRLNEIASDISSA